MTTPTEGQLAAARRLVAHPRFEWLAGTAWLRLPSGAPDDGDDYGRISDLGEDRAAIAYAKAYGRDVYIPDPNDHGTLGCLLALVREAWGQDGGTYRTSIGWRHYSPNGILRGSGPTEFEALVAALEAAPVKETA